MIRCITFHREHNRMPEESFVQHDDNKSYAAYGVVHNTKPKNKMCA